MTDWAPATEAEDAMREALRAGDQELYFRILARAELLLPVSPEVPADQAATGWGTWTTGGRTHLLAFTSDEALRACLTDHTGSVRGTTYHDLADGWPNLQWWLAVNPGLPIEGYLPAWFVSQLARGDVRLPGRTIGARARLERVETVAGTRGGGAPADAHEAAGPTAPPELSGSSEDNTPGRGTWGDRIPHQAAPTSGAGPDGRSRDSDRADRSGQPEHGAPAAMGPDGLATTPTGTSTEVRTGASAGPRPDPRTGSGPSGDGPSGDEPSGDGSHERTAALPLLAGAGSPTTDDPGPAVTAAPVTRPSGGRRRAEESPRGPGGLPTRTPGTHAVFREGGGGWAGAWGPADPRAEPAAAPERDAAATRGSAPGGDEAVRGTAERDAASVRGSARGGDEPFVPANDVEANLFAAAGDGSTDKFLSTLLLATVLLPVPADAPAGALPGEGGFRWRTSLLGGESYLLVFTSPQRLADYQAARGERQPPPTATVRFIQLIRAWPDPGWSFAVNPGTPVGATLPGGQIVALANWAADVGLGVDAGTAAGTGTTAGQSEASGADRSYTLMQKAVPPGHVGYYLERGYDRVSGFVHRTNEVDHLSTPDELVSALGLRYPGSPFAGPLSELYVLRWPAYRPGLYRIPYGGSTESAMRAMEGWVIERPPFRGNGFAPGDTGQVIAEFKLDSARLPHGAELWRLGADGSTTLQSRYDADHTAWREAGRPDA